MFQGPAANVCSIGFHTWVQLRSTNVTRPRMRASRGPRRVASNSPATPPPTITMRWVLHGDGFMSELSTSAFFGGWASREQHSPSADDKPDHHQNRQTDQAAPKKMSRPSMMLMHGLPHGVSSRTMASKQRTNGAGHDATPSNGGQPTISVAAGMRHSSTACVLLEPFAMCVGTSNCR